MKSIIEIEREVVEGINYYEINSKVINKAKEYEELFKQAQIVAKRNIAAGKNILKLTRAITTGSKIEYTSSKDPNPDIIAKLNELGVVDGLIIATSELNKMIEPAGFKCTTQLKPYFNLSKTCKHINGKSVAHIKVSSK
jgi:hypothetical protein